MGLANHQECASLRSQSADQQQQAFTVGVIPSLPGGSNAAGIGTMAITAPLPGRKWENTLIAFYPWSGRVDLQVVLLLLFSCDLIF